MIRTKKHQRLVRLISCLVLIVFSLSARADNSSISARTASDGSWLHGELLKFDLPKDTNELEKISKRAETGDVGAQYALGLYYRQPLDPDHMEVMADTSKSNEKSKVGNFINGAPGKNKSGLPTYDETKPLIAKNWDLSVKWFQRAANQGFGPAQRALGELYDIEGPTYDAAKAYYWTALATRKAANEGDELAKHAKMPSLLGSKLPSAKKAEIDNELKEWKPLKEKP